MVGAFFSPQTPQDLRITRKPTTASKRDQCRGQGCSPTTAGCALRASLCQPLPHVTSALEGPWQLDSVPITRNTASPFRDQDPGTGWSPTCQTQTCWEYSGPSRSKDMSKGVVGPGSLSQCPSSHTVPHPYTLVCSLLGRPLPSWSHLFTQPASLDNSQRC